MPKCNFYPYDPTTGNKLTRSGFTVNAVQPMTQKEVDAQCDMVNDYLEQQKQPMQAKHLEVLIQKCDADAEVHITIDGKKAEIVEWYVGSHDKSPHLTAEVKQDD